MERRRTVSIRAVPRNIFGINLCFVKKTEKGLKTAQSMVHYGKKKNGIPLSETKMEGKALTMKNKLFHKSPDTAASSAQTAQNPPADPPEVVITIETMIAGKVEFVFQDYKIHFKHDSRYRCPPGASVNGIPWPDMEKPFEMGFTPDFSFAEIYAKSGRGVIELSVKRERFVLSIDDSEGSPAPYQVSISMKRQSSATDKPAAPDKPVAKFANPGKPVKKRRKR